MGTGGGHGVWGVACPAHPDGSQRGGAGHWSGGRRALPVRREGRRVLVRDDHARWVAAVCGAIGRSIGTFGPLARGSPLRQLRSPPLPHLRHGSAHAFASGGARPVPIHCALRHGRGSRGTACHAPACQPEAGWRRAGFVCVCVCVFVCLRCAEMASRRKPWEAELGRGATSAEITRCACAPVLARAHSRTHTPTITRARRRRRGRSGLRFWALRVRRSIGNAMWAL
jgi:hypothetical protein